METIPCFLSWLTWKPGGTQTPDIMEIFQIQPSRMMCIVWFSTLQVPFITKKRSPKGKGPQVVVSTIFCFRHHFKRKNIVFPQAFFRKYVIVYCFQESRAKNFEMRMDSCFLNNIPWNLPARYPKWHLIWSRRYVFQAGIFGMLNFSGVQWQR